MHRSDLIDITAPRQGLFPITAQVRRWFDASPVRRGLLTLFIQHTSASLLIQENASPEASRDLERWLAGLAPESSAYAHQDEGPDDMPAHLRAAITATSLAIPIVDGRLALGRWQGIFLFEHRRKPPPRGIAIHLSGE